MTLDFASVVKFLYPLLVSIYNLLPATVNPAVKVLLSLALQVLGQFANQASIPVVGAESHHMFGAYLPRELPSEDQWTPEGLKAYAEKATA